MMWRPKGWATRSVKSFTSKDMKDCTGREVFEAGADAVLMTLREEGQHYDKGSSDEVWWLNAEKAFTLVFIPDEEVSK